MDEVLQRVIIECCLLLRDAMQRAVMPQYVVCPSVCPSVAWSHRLEYFENNFTPD